MPMINVDFQLKRRPFNQGPSQSRDGDSALKGGPAAGRFSPLVHNVRNFYWKNVSICTFRNKTAHIKEFLSILIANEMYSIL